MPGASSRTRFGILLLAGALAAGCGSERSTPSLATPSRRPAIVLVTLDTTRADHVGAMGASFAKTPTFDRIAREGTLFTHAWSVAPLTTPAHASIMTGVLPRTHGVRNNGRLRLPESAKTLAEILHDAGYATGAFVGALPVSHVFGFAQGFDVFDDDFRAGAAGVAPSERRGDAVVDAALPWLRERLAGPSRQPFFLWVHLYDAHSPCDAPPFPGRESCASPYDAEMAFVDLQVHRILDELDRATDTPLIVVLAGDHGEGLGDHGESTHGLLVSEATLHVPLAMRGPGIESGRRSEELASVEDIAPTLLARIGLPIPPSMDGVDLLAHRDRERVLMAESLHGFEVYGWSPLFALRRGDEKWVVAPRRERFDLASDPAETKNLFGQDPAADAKWEAVASDMLSAPAVAGGEHATLDEHEREQLESLGYVGGGNEPATSATSVAGRDPNEAIADHERYVTCSSRVARGPSELPEAIACLRELVASDPGNAEFATKLAQALRISGDVAASEAAYHAVLAAHPDDYFALLGLATLLDGARRFPESINLQRGFISAHPGNAGAEIRLGQTLLRAGSAQDALLIAETQLREHGPSDVESQILAMQSLAALGRLGEALDRCHAALLLRRGHPDLLAAEKDYAARLAAGRGTP